MNEETEQFTIWHGLFLAEFCALLIALAMTIVPGKTGSRYGIAGYFYDEPSFPQEFVVNLIGIHMVMLVIVLVVFVWVRLSGVARPSNS